MRLAIDGARLVLALGEADQDGERIIAEASGHSQPDVDADIAKFIDYASQSSIGSKRGSPGMSVGALVGSRRQCADRVG
jgi:hypothetical protein